MLINDKQVGTPQVPYKDTKAAIEALTGIVEGAHAYATDTNEPGWYDGASWQWNDQYLLANGTRPLSADWDAGSWQIRAETFQSDIATGTAPLTVASTTMVTNLNADLHNGYNQSDLDLINWMF